MKGFFKILLSVTVAAGMLASCQPSGNGVAPARDTVIISDMKFHPEELYVNKWDTVVWVNRDIVSHDVTAFPGKEWTSDTLPSGHSWEKEADGTFDYFCSIHPTMKGKVIIRQQ
jgi:plastocyanin